MEEVKPEILADVKMLLGFEDGSHDDVLLFLIESVINDALAYCRLAFLPRQLYGLIAQITVKLWQTEIGGENYASVKSVTEGDRRIEFDLSADGALGGWHDRLKPYVNKSGRLPSEICREDAP